MYKGFSLRQTADFSSEMVGSENNGMVYSKFCQLRILYLIQVSFKNESEIKKFPDKQNQKGLITSRLALQQILKGVL